MVNWGGAWTEEKLRRVVGYLEAFQKVLKNKPYKLVYIDAFCGGGELDIRGGEALPLLQEGRRFTEGSAKRALALQTPFHRYHFIDRSQASLDNLKRHVEDHHPALLDCVHFHVGDVNVELPKVSAALNVATDRAVVFLDPFGMQVDWDTMTALARATVDLWYLAPTMAMNRMIAGDFEVLERQNWEARLDKFMGTTAWREKWYARTATPSLFGTDERFVRTATIEKIEADFHERLKTAFFMSPRRLQLRDGNNLLFTLMFGCTNKHATSVAMKIADHLLKG